MSLPAFSTVVLFNLMKQKICKRHCSTASIMVERISILKEGISKPSLPLPSYCSAVPVLSRHSRSESAVYFPGHWEVTAGREEGVESTVVTCASRWVAAQRLSCPQGCAAWASLAAAWHHLLRCVCQQRCCKRLCGTTGAHTLQMHCWLHSHLH